MANEKSYSEIITNNVKMGRLLLLRDNRKKKYLYWDKGMMLIPFPIEAINNLKWWADNLYLRWNKVFKIGSEQVQTEIIKSDHVQDVFSELDMIKPFTKLDLSGLWMVNISENESPLYGAYSFKDRAIIKKQDNCEDLCKSLCVVYLKSQRLYHDGRLDFSLLNKYDLKLEREEDIYMIDRVNNPERNPSPVR